MIITNLLQENEKILKAEKLQFAEDIEAGLSTNPKRIPSKYFYDNKGSKLFQKITTLDEYYVTRTEVSILENIKSILPDIVGELEVDIVELGVGDGHKTKIIIDSFLGKNIKVNFYPIDISDEALRMLEKNILESDRLKIHGLVADYIEGMNFARIHSGNRQIILFLGSNIGNFSKPDSQIILKKIKTIMNQDDFLLIGFDLKKDAEVLNHAYSDHEGVTALFNLNVLERINEELGGDFQLKNFKHLAFYNPIIGAMESYLLSQKEQTVTINALKRTFSFEAFEPIHLEYSFKYLEKDIQELSKRGGFTQIANFYDDNRYYIDSLWQVH